MKIQSAKFRHKSGGEWEYGVYIHTKDRRTVLINQFGERLIQDYYHIEAMPEMFSVELFKELPYATTS